MTIEDYRDRVKRAGILYVDVYPFLTNNRGGVDFLLLKRREDVALPSSWQPVCGKIAKDEEIRHAFVRQAYEKTGQQPTELYKLDTVNIFYDEFYDTVMLVPVAAARLANRDVKLNTSLHCEHRWVHGQDVEQFLQFPKQVECIRMIEDSLRGGRPSIRMQPLEFDGV